MDMGTGGGRAALALSEAGFAPAYGFDFLPEFIDTARLNAKERNLDIRFEVGNALDINLPDSSVSVALYWEKLLSYIPDPGERQKAINEAFRVLSPGGFLFSSYNQFSSRRLNILLRLYMKFIRMTIRQDRPERSLPILTRGGVFSPRALLPGSPHVYWHHADEAVQELANSGFRIIEIFSSIGFRQKNMMSYEKLKKGILYVVAQKPW